MAAVASTADQAFSASQRESPRDLLRNLIERDDSAPDEWRIPPGPGLHALETITYLWLGAGTFRQRRELVHRVAWWRYVSLKSEVSDAMGEHDKAALLRTQLKAKREAAAAVVEAAFVDGLRLRLGRPLVVPMLANLERARIAASAPADLHPLDGAPWHQLAYEFFLAMRRELNPEGVERPRGLAVCGSCTLVFEPARKKTASFCPGCSKNSVRAQRARPNVPTLARGQSTTIGGLPHSLTAEAKTMTVNRCLECGEYFPGRRARTFCTKAHEQRHRRRAR